MKVLAGDIGGTNTRFALVEVDQAGVREITRRRSYDSADFQGAEAALRRFVDEEDVRADRASLAMACPVRDGACTLPNLGWTVDERSLGRILGPRGPDLRVLNDFEAVGHAIAFLEAPDLEELQAGRPNPSGVIALIGPGTGLGEGFGVPGEDGQLQVCASEGGHADFAPRSEIEWQLRAHLETTYGRVSNERVLSGPGLEATYDFLLGAAERRDVADVATVAGPAANGQDRAAVIAELGMNGSDPVCARALDLFVSAFGARAGNLALTTGATGGVYVAGGIAPKILARLRERDFLAAFRDKDRLSTYLEAIPVRVIVNPDVGLMGAAIAGARWEPS